MIHSSRAAGLFIAAMAGAFAAEPPPLTLSHSWIVVTTGAPERKALVSAGFRIAPTVNRHEGQGTASVTVEFLNGFLELLYPDSTVPVSPALRAGAEKFRLRSAWRETGYSPIGIVFERTAATPKTLPFATWRVSAEWMEPGTFIELMTPREMPKAVSLSISSHPGSSESENERLAQDPLRGFPREARRDAGHQLGLVQHGLEPRDWKAMPSVGAGVYEIRVHGGTEYRVFYIAKFAEGVYVLHAFEKRTRRTRPADIDLARKRLRDLRRLRQAREERL